MKRFLSIVMVVVTIAAGGCRSKYNEEAVQKLIKQPEIRAWADTFENNSNLNHSKHYEVMVVSSKDLPGREVRAIKDYLKDKYKTDNVNYYYRKDAYTYGVDSSEKADK